MRVPLLPLSFLSLSLLAAPVAAAPGQGPGPGPAWHIVTEQGSRDVRETAVRGFAALPLSALVSLGAEVAYGRDGVSVHLGEHDLAFRVNSPEFRMGEASYRLASPVYEDDGVVYLPAQFFRDYLARAAGRLLSVDGAGRVIRVAETAPRPASRPAPRAVAASLSGGTEVGPVEEVYRPRDARAPAAVPLRPAEPGYEGAPADDGAPSAGEGQAPRGAAGGPQKRLVVVDAGHGGVDPGARGPGGVREKDVTLAVARHLAALLREDPTLEVRMTRDRDTLIALHDRTRLANRWKDEGQTALFISVHCNANPSRAARGFETYFLSEARTEDARRVEAMENAAAEYETESRPRGSGGALDFIFNDLRQNQYLRESSEWAEVIQDHLDGVPSPNRGVKQAGFHVLVGAYMPAVLVEIGFISNSAEEQMLASPGHQRAVAGRLASAVRDFLDRSGQEPSRRSSSGGR